MTAEDVDWTSRTITYFRMKTGSRAQFTISKKLETVLSTCPQRAHCSRDSRRSRRTTGQAGFAAVVSGRELRSDAA